MCGICGVFTARQYQAGSSIFDMTRSLRHRGPDDEGYLLGNTRSHTWKMATGPETIAEIPDNPIGHHAREKYNLAFGMRRLAILDLSPLGHGPMSYRNGSYWITYNGEVYNYIELRQELSSLGYQFQTATDTEVVLAAYAEWGPDCLKRFNGMWAFAIWDVKEQKLFCARDRFGIKPFTYYWDGSIFAFASEAKSLLQHPRITAKPDDSMVFDYLVMGLSHHREKTFFDGISNLLPAHYALLDLSRNELIFQKWWDVDLNTSLDVQGHGSDSDTIEEFSALLNDAVQLRLRTDVPIGTCLSGGLDSSVLVGIVNQLLLDGRVLPSEIIGDHQKTFSACFDDAQIDERPYISQVIQRTNAHASYVFPEGRSGLWREINDLHWYQEGPVGSTSIYSQWAVMRLAKENQVTVLLDGQGADELLAGYSYYFGSYLAQIARQRSLMRAILEATRASSASKSSLPLIFGLMLYELSPPAIKRLGRNSINTRFRTNKTVPIHLLDTRFANQFESNSSKYFKHQGYNSLAEHLYDSIQTSSLPALLHYEDRNSMAFSIEARVPYLDYRLVEFVFSLAASYRIREGWSKWILRAGGNNIAPEDIRWRKGKLGFATPESKWMDSGVNIINKLFKDDTIYSSRYFNTSTINQLRNYSNGRLRDTASIWRMISLEFWIRRFLG
ncbi:MAG: asparagine synthase (glutamine-hydrolyzing) [Chloroflexi bacterium]|nr:MAG: asparagine synthase (glutamine-hydrolyzing) [Chloroflexota bacterium]MBL1193113.1 asparagine synthase (glutamine-hydrolyzing) [Chloroflexota bacterium]NOH10406.1 asparagine synthase (glutamine-hydrolyzing) [Chloroflexota bacterium]